MSFASDQAMMVLNQFFPQADATPWRGAAGAEAKHVQLGNGKRADLIQLYASGDERSWFACAAVNGTTYEEVASSMAEAARKLRATVKEL